MKKTLLTLLAFTTLSFSTYAQCTSCPIPFVAASQAQGTSTSVTVPKPTGVQPGHFMIAAIHDGWCGTGGAVTAPVGWTLINFTINTGSGCGSTSTARQLHTFYRVAGNTEPANYTFTGNTSQIYVGAIVAYSGVNPTTPINASSTFGAQDLCGTIVGNSVTTTATCTRLVGVFFCSVNFSGNNIIPPNSMTERVDVGNTGNHPWGNENVEIADEMLSASGASGNRTAALSGCSSNGWPTGAQLIAINCSVSTGVNDIDLNDLIYVSPNPSSGMVELKIGDGLAERKANVEIFNSIGEKMMTTLAAGSTTSLDLTSYAKGIYFVKVILPEGIVTKKIVLE